MGEIFEFSKYKDKYSKYKDKKIIKKILENYNLDEDEYGDEDETVYLKGQKIPNLLKDRPININFYTKE